MENVIFEGLKLRSTEFRFKNAKANGEYFDNALRSGVEVYKGEVRRFMKETLHIYLSYLMIIKVFLGINVIAVVLVSDMRMKLIMLGLTAVTGIATLLWNRIVSNYNVKMNFTDGMNDVMDEALYEVREELLKEDNKNA